ncbi:DUF4123 domain-containing protein [Pseudomonas sp. PDM13]|uniref:DUF4123 domain-containing protein n=1 Tax=Pseudomonas sp. PDM13 TaxID=2769255 RepID=UPI0021DF950D|nr:DUF4123 domain-containing protein [Pseudomonas sp. PDM13]MCU9949059.1 DUF4123 domain-containing protein [Pseudomonas sp. PDM13]
MSRPLVSWLEQIAHMASASELGHVDLLVDQANCEHAVLPALKLIEPDMPWFSLFSGLPEEALLDQAPLLMRLSLDEWRHRSWLEELVEHLAPQSRLVLLMSPLPFESLARTLQGLSQLEWGGQSGLLRFYDPRVLPHLLKDVLSPEQREHFLGMALFWGWLDRDQQPVWQPGTYRSSAAATEPLPAIVLTDQQYFSLGRLSDAQQLLGLASERLPNDTNEKRFEACCRLVLKAEQEGNFGDIHAYAIGNFEYI